MKAISDMTEPELRTPMIDTATAVKATLPDGTLFLVLAFDAPGRAQYIANCRRQDVVAVMRACADRIEAHEDIPR